MDKFTEAYIECALWSSTDDKGIPLDEDYYSRDIAEPALKTMQDDCKNFQEQNADLLSQAGDDEQNGHDFWLTRNRHGAGFWDRGYKGDLGEKLKEAAHSYGSCDLYVGDDGKIYIQ